MTTHGITISKFVRKKREIYAIFLIHYYTIFPLNFLLILRIAVFWILMLEKDQNIQIYIVLPRSTDATKRSHRHREQRLETGIAAREGY